MRLSPLAVLVFALLTLFGVAADARPGRGGGGAGPRAGGGGPSIGGVHGPGNAGGMQHAPRPQAGAQGPGGALTGPRTGTAGPGKLPGQNLPGRGPEGIGNHVGPGAGDRVSPDQLNRFLDLPQSRERGVADGDRRTNHQERHQQRRAQAQQVHSNVRSQIGAMSQELFTPSWYSNHPNAWQWSHPHADAWAVASFGTAARWIGVAAAPIGYGYTDGTVVYEETNVYTDNSYAVSTGTAEQADAAAALAATAETFENRRAEWLPLGVFALAGPDQSSATMVVQLQVSKEGILSGSYVDLISQQGTAVRGAIDKNSQHAAWTIGDNKDVVFETALANLTTDTAPVVVRFGEKSAQQWTLVRMEESK